MTEQQEQLAMDVVNTLLARRDVDAEIMSGRGKSLPRDTPYWNGLMIRSRDTMVANDKAVAAYREFIERNS